MTWYKLPDALGGGEVELVHGFVRADGMHDVKMDGLGVLTVPFRWLTEIKPPLPPEPPTGSVVMVGEGEDADVYHRRGDDFRKSAPWADTDGEMLTWVYICGTGTPVRLIPEPEPVEPPWRWTDEDGDSIAVHASGTAGCVRVQQNEYAVDLTPDACREMARALWSAAGGAS